MLSEESSLYSEIRRLRQKQVLGLLGPFVQGDASFEDCIKLVEQYLSMVDMVLKDARAYAKEYAIPLLKMLRSWMADTDLNAYSLIDSPKTDTRCKLILMNTDMIEGQWLQDLLVEGLGLYRTAYGVEACEMPFGSYYLYCDFPGAEHVTDMQLGFYQEFASTCALLSAVGLDSKEDFDSLRGEALVQLYKRSIVHVNAYLFEEELPGNKPCSLSFSRTGEGTAVTDDNTGHEFFTDVPLETAEEFIAFARHYGAARKPGGHSFTLYE